MSRQLLLDKISTDKQFSPKALLQLNAIWQHGTHVRAYGVQSTGVLEKLYIRLISTQHSSVQKGRTAEFSATFWYRISKKSFGLYLNVGKYMELFE
jgi:hypothetical protein